jgi:hypothetical protein
MQRVTQIVPCQWPDLGILVQRVAHSGSAHPLDKQFLESVAHFVDDGAPEAARPQRELVADQET